MQLSPSLPFSEHALANISRLTAEIKNRWRWLFTMRLAREKNDSVPDSFNTMLTLDALRRDWRIKRKLHNYIEEPSKWQRYNIYMATLTLSVDFKVSGRERILHLCSSTKQKNPSPQGWHILRFSLQHSVWVNKTGRRRNVDHCTGGSISSSLRPVPSRVRAIYKEGERESHWNISLSLQQATAEGCKWHSKHSELLPLHGRTKIVASSSL